MAIVLKSSGHSNEIRDLVVKNWSDMRGERSILEDTWKRCLMATLSKFDKSWETYAKQAGRSHRYVAISGDAVDTLLPQIYDAIFGQDDWLKIRSVREGFGSMAEIYAENMKYYLLHQHRHTGFSKTAKMAIKSLIMLGNCPTSSTWYTREAVDYEATTDEMNRWAEESAAYQMEHQEIMAEYRKSSLQATILDPNAPPLPPPDFKEPPMPPPDSKIAFAGPKINIGSIFNYVQEQHPNEEESSIRIMRTWRTKAYLKEKAEPMEDGYRLYDNIKAVMNMNSEDRAPDNEAEILYKMAMGMQMPHGKDKVEVKEMHGTFEIGSGYERTIYKNYIATVANDLHLIRCEPSPFFSGRPMIWNARIGLTEGAVYGVGPIEKGLDEQDSVNAIHNQTIDAVNCVIQPELEIVRDFLADGVMQPSGPGARHYVTEKGAITPIVKNFQGIPIGFEAVREAMSRHERITGATNTAPQGNETATRTARNSGIIATKLGGHITDIEAEFLTPALSMEIEMNAQYITEDQMFTVTKDKKILPISISPEQVRRGYVAIPMGSKFLAEKQERIQNLMMALQISQSNPDGSPTPVNKPELYRLLYREIIGESDNIVMSEEEFKKAIAEYEQKQIAMMQMEAEAKRVESGQTDGAGPGQNTAGVQPGPTGPAN